MTVKTIISILFVAVIAVNFWAGYMAGKEAGIKQVQKWLKQNHIVDYTGTIDKDASILEKASSINLTEEQRRQL